MAPPNVWSGRCRFSTNLILLALLSSSTTAEPFYTALSPAIRDGFLNKSPTICPIAQDGYTSNTFPWTHVPTCVDITIPHPNGIDVGSTQTFCTYTNAEYNGARGISLVVTPEVAVSITSETFGMAVGGLEGQIGEELGMFEVKDTETRGKGLFAREDIAAIFAGESLIIRTPALLISKDLINTSPSTEKQLVLSTAVGQLPSSTRYAIEKLGTNSQSLGERLKSNGIIMKWPWVDEGPHLIAVTPEAARINHACRPNAMWRFNDHTLAFEVVALKTIKPGEEITLSYGFETRTHRRRTRSIKANLGFDCQCPLCTADSDGIEASNDRLGEIKALKSVLPKDEKDTPQLLGLLPSLISQLEEEDLHQEMPMYEEILAYTWSSFGIEDRAKYWAGRARKHWAIIAGKESWEQRRCGELENDVKGHSTWMSWEGDPWEGVGKGHPWDEKSGESNNHDHEHK